MDTATKTIHEKITYIIPDNEMLHTYQMFEMAIYDYNSSINAARQEGIAIGKQRAIDRGEERGIAIGEKRGIAIGEQRGIAIGEQKAKALFAINMKRNGFSIEEIATCVMLSKEEVVKILEKEGLI